MSGQFWKPRYSPWLVAIGVMSSTIMEVLDTSIANVALPHIAGSTGASTDEATWVVTSYLVANAIVLPLTGWLGRTFGRKRFLMVCIVAFTAASAMAGAAQTLEELIVFRILQGIGGGALQPVAQAILMESFPPHKRGAAMAFYGVGIVVAPVLGPIVGGWLTDNYSWRWAFYINVPVGAISLAMNYFLLEDPPYLKNQPKTDVDYWGFSFLVLWVSALQIGLDKGQNENWFDSPFIVILAIVFLFFLGLFIVWELWTEHPIVDLRVMTDKNFALATMLIFVVGAALYGSVTLSPLFLQSVLRFPAYDAGLAVAPRGLGAMATMALIGPLLSRVDGRYFVCVGFTLLGASNIWLGRQLNLDTGVIQVVLPNVLQGIAIGQIFVPLTTIANAHTPLHKMGATAGIYNLMRNLGGSVGIALSTTWVARGAQAQQTYQGEHINVFNYISNFYHATYNAVAGQEAGLGLLYRTLLQQASIVAYVDTFTLTGIICIAVAPAIFILPRPPLHKGGPGADMH